MRDHICSMHAWLNLIVNYGVIGGLLHTVDIAYRALSGACCTGGRVESCATVVAGEPA
jgi:hypothetical protein